MADTKNTQTAPAGLPEKEWFTLEEVAARWGCSVDDLLHYEEFGFLKIAVLLKYPLRSAEKIEDLTGRSGFLYIHRICYPNSCFSVQLAHGENIYFTHASRAIADKLIGYYHPMRRLYPEEKFRVYEIKGGNGRRDKDEGVSISKYDLRITRIERDSFEQKHRIGAYAGTMPDLNKSDTIDPRKEATYLQLVRLLDKQLGLPDEPYKAAGVLKNAAASKGVAVPKSEDTLVKILKAARAS